MRITLIALAIVACSPISQADDFIVYGKGNSTCAKFIDAHANQSDYYSYTSWVLGWVSSADDYRNKPLPETTSEAIIATARLYCAKHPTSEVSDAANYIVQQLATDDH